MKKTRKILALGLSFVMMLGLCLTAGTVNAADTTEKVKTAEEFIEAANDPNIDVIEIAGSISINTTIEGDDGFGQITNKTIKDVRTTKSNDWHDNLLNIVSGGEVTFNNVTFEANKNTKNLLSINGNAKVVLTGTTFVHTLAYDGAPIIIKDQADVTFQEGLTFKLGEKSWYGVNVDGSATADFTNVSKIECDTKIPTQSVVCLDNNDAESVKGLPYSTVTTAADGGEGEQQIAFVQAEDLVEFITAKQNQSKDVETVVVKERVTLNKTLSLNEDMTINCEGDGAFVAGSNLNDNVVTVISPAKVTLNNVKIETRVNAAKSGLHIYGGDVTANNLTIINENTHKNADGKPDGGAAIVLNGGNLTLNGTTTFQLGEDAWGGVNIDNKNGDPKMTVGSNATINVTSPKESVGLYYVDTDKQDTISLGTAVSLPDTVKVTINNKEVTVDNGVITTPTEPTKPTDPEKPEQPEEEKITITLKAIVDGKEINLEELGLKPEQYILPVEKGIAFTADDLKVLDEMKESLSVDGYTFRGYFLDAKGTEALKADVPFNADATIYMIWDKEVDVTVTPNPGDTEKPNTEKPNTDNTNKPEQKPTTTDKTVKTDDSSNAALYGLMISLSVVGAGIVVLAKKREELLNK